MIGGRIDFDDGPKKTRHEVRGIDLAVPFVSNLPYYVERYIQPSFSAVVNGNAVSLKGRSKPFSDTRESAFDIKIMDLNVPYYLEYLPIRREYEVPSAFLDVIAVVSFAQPKEKPPTVRVEGDVILRELRVRGSDKSPMVHLPMVKVSISPSDIVSREFRIASLLVKDPEIDAVIDRSGRLNLLMLSTRKDKINNTKNPSVPLAGRAKPAGPAMKMSIDAIRLSGGKVRFSDASRASPFRTLLTEIRIDVERLDTGKEKSADALLSFRTEAGETFDLTGGEGEPDRVFLVEPKTLAPERKEKLRDGRVDFRIR